MPCLWAECLPPSLEPKPQPSGRASGLKPLAADPCHRPPSRSPSGRPGALGANGKSGPGVHQGRLKQLALRDQPLLPPNPKLNAKPHPTGHPHPQPDMMASASRAAGTAAHPQTFPSSGHSGGRGWPLSLIRITPCSSSKLDGAITQGHCWARPTAGPGLGQREGGHMEPWGLHQGGSRWDPGCLHDGLLFWAGPGNADTSKSLEQSFSPGQEGVRPEGKIQDPGLKLGNGGAGRRLEGLDQRGRKAISRWETPREGASLEEAGPEEGRREVRGQTGPRDGGEGQASRSPEPGGHRVRGALWGGVGGSPLQGHERTRTEVMISGDGPLRAGGGSRTQEGGSQWGCRTVGRVSPEPTTQRSVAPGPLRRGQEAEARVSEQRTGSFLLRGRRGTDRDSCTALVAARPGAPAHWALRGGVCISSSCGQHPER